MKCFHFIAQQPKDCYNESGRLQRCNTLQKMYKIKEENMKQNNWFRRMVAAILVAGALMSVCAPALAASSEYFAYSMACGIGEEETRL